MLVRELAVLNTQIFTVEQPIFICFTPARRMVWNELSSQNEQVAIHMQYVDEEVGHRSCLALIPWSGPLCVPIFPVFSKAKPVYYLTRAGRMLVTELAVLNTQTSKLVIEEPTIHLTEAGRLVLDELSAPSDSHSQPNREDSGFPYEKLQLVGNWGSFHFHYWNIHYGRVQQNEEDMHHLCIVRGVEMQLWWSRVIQEKILDPWGLVQVVLTNKKLTGIKFLGRRIHGLMSCLVKRRSEFTYYEDAQQVDISTTVEGYQERGDEMMSYQFSTSDIITTPHEPSSGSSHQFPQNSTPPLSLPIPLPVPLHLTTPPRTRTRPLTALLRRYFENQGTTNFSLRLAGIRRAMEALTSSDSTSLNYLTHAGRMVLSGLSELNQQDVRQFQQAYDLLVNFINEPANRERLEQEMALVGVGLHASLSVSCRHHLLI
ncbi:uncharacterized protein LOC121563391 [Coregonus clupeaformis]|uniref:uncharacterized protein LOC121563391 n=1 Tax=Coregonus clupeaformis TaxID=59861 RepID=UPI001E1C2A62|nr:uncharacterized protein LOC121563391 [Coregonus clupeaformis]